MSLKYQTMRAFIASLLLMVSGLIYAQRPTNIPEPSEPFNVFESAENIIFYIVLPVIIIVLYIIWRRRISREKEKETDKYKE